MKFNQKKLENGLRIITVPMLDNPAVTILVMVETGSEYEKKETSGLSHFLEHMMFKGTPRRPKSIDISRELESLGAHYNAFTGNEYTGYYAKVAKDHLDTAIDIVSDIYLNPLLDQKEIDKEKGVIIEEMKMYQDMPHRHIHHIFSELVYGDQPAGRNIVGNENTINSFNRDDFKKYLDEHYVAESTIVVVSGNFDENETVNKIEKIFSGISNGSKTKKIKVDENQDSARLALKFKETDQTHLVIGVRSLNSKDEKDPVLSVLGAILGSGMSSRLFQKLREEMGVCYYVRAGNDSYTDHGMFTISAGVDVKRVEEVIKTLLDECRKIADEGVSRDELKKVKDYITGSFVLGLETSDSRAEYVAMNEIMKGKIESPDEEIAKIQNVSASDVQEMARAIFKDDKLNLAIIGPYKEDETNINRFMNLLTFGK